MSNNDLVPKIRAVLKRDGRLGDAANQVATNDDLYAAGMTSLANANVMVALEDEFGVEFPDHLLSRETFQSIDSIHKALSSLL